MSKNWDPSKESFDKLLEWLDPDREEAAQKYEKLRMRLVRFFMCNGCGDNAETLSDETIDRVMKKLEKDEVPEPYIGEKIFYFVGFARNVCREHLREAVPREVPPPMIPPDDVEAEHSCLEECLQTLETEDRWLAVEYYRFNRAAKIAHRQRLAEQFRLSLAGLRSRVHRIREDLKPCIKECLEANLAH